MQEKHPALRTEDNLHTACKTCGLQQLCLPAGINMQTVQQLERIVRSKQPYARGQMLYQPGIAFHSLFVVRSGSFKTFFTSVSGETQILGFHLPGEIMGLDAIHSGQYMGTAEALERASVCALPYEKLNQVTEQLPQLQQQLMRVFSREIAYEHEHLIMMGRRQAQERLVIFLHNMAIRYARLQRDPQLITLPMSRHDLANYLGLVIETVSRLFSRLQTNGIIQVNRKQIAIHDLSALEQLIGEVNQPHKKTRNSNLIARAS